MPPCPRSACAWAASTTTRQRGPHRAPPHFLRNARQLLLRDYFKEDAIRFAWTFITEDLKLPKDRLYITVYKDDDEAFELWQKVAGVAPERIFRLGEKDNFWSMGDTGPLRTLFGIHFDQGADMACGPDCGIGKRLRPFP